MPKKFGSSFNPLSRLCEIISNATKIMVYQLLYTIVVYVKFSFDKKFSVDEPAGLS